MSDIVRNIDTVTAEIIVIRDNAKKVFYDAVIKIGCRLLEAKDLVPHGEWTHYLQSVLGYTPSTAQNYMRIASAFSGNQVGFDGKSQDELFGELGYAQLLPLLGLPDEERRELAAENDLPSMSSREINKLVSDYKEARAALKDADERSAEALEKMEKAEKAQKKAEEAETNERNARLAAEEKIGALEGQVQKLMEEAKTIPIQAEVVPDEKALEAARQAVRDEMQKAVRQAEEKAKAAEGKLAKAKNPLAMKVNLLFEDMQSMTSRLENALAALAQEQPETAEKFRTTIGQFMTLKGESMQ